MRYITSRYIFYIQKKEIQNAAKGRDYRQRPIISIPTRDFYLGNSSDRVNIVPHPPINPKKPLLEKRKTALFFA